VRLTSSRSLSFASFIRPGFNSVRNCRINSGPNWGNCAQNRVTGLDLVMRPKYFPLGLFGSDNSDEFGSVIRLWYSPLDARLIAGRKFAPRSLDNSPVDIGSEILGSGPTRLFGPNLIRTRIF
jgi:hypothetical protein